MKLLAIETATLFGGVAIMDSDSGLLYEARMSVKSGHAERVMSEIERALKSTGLALRDLDALAVAAGPGGFTGLRIGLGSAKGLCFSNPSLSLVAVGTLEAMAASFPISSMPICPMLDARKKEVYAGLYAPGLPPVRLMDDAAIKPARLASLLAERPEVQRAGALLCGQGAELYKETLKSALGPLARFAPRHLMHSSPAALAELGLGLALEGSYCDPATIAPVYLRKSEAEMKGGG